MFGIFIRRLPAYRGTMYEHDGGYSVWRAGFPPRPLTNGIVRNLREHGFEGDGVHVGSRLVALRRS